MTFLQKRNVISKEFQFRFMRRQNKDEKLFFACPAKCGNYLIDVDPTYVLREHAPAVKTERCPCGKGVCVQCHQLVPEHEFYTHRCPEASADHTMDDAASLALMKKIGKQCPNCNNFIIKNDGCNVMMCGDRAHGSLRKAIKSGGCGQQFYWTTLEKYVTNFHNDLTQNDRVESSDPPVRYRQEIAKYKKELGIEMSNEENLVATIDFDSLEVEINPQLLRQQQEGRRVAASTPNAPIDLSRPLLIDQDNSALVQAIHERDPYPYLVEIVRAYHSTPRYRIVTNSHIVHRETLTASMIRKEMKKRMDIFGVIGDKTLEDEWCCCYLSICWCPNLFLNVFFLHLKRCFCPCIYHGNKTSLYLHIAYPLVAIPLTLFLSSWIEGPLVILSWFFFVWACLHYIVVALVEKSVRFGDLLTYACAHGSQDIVRLLLQHGADPNGQLEVRHIYQKPKPTTISHPTWAQYREPLYISPIITSLVHGSWNCIDILESTNDQQIGSYNHELDLPLYDVHNADSENWLTQKRLHQVVENRYNFRVCCFFTIESQCTPRCCSTCFCRHRAKPRSRMELERRALHRVPCDWCCSMWMFIIWCLIPLIVLSISWTQHGYFWRLNIDECIHVGGNFSNHDICMCGTAICQPPGKKMNDFFFTGRNNTVTDGNFCYDKTSHCSTSVIPVW